MSDPTDRFIEIGAEFVAHGKKPWDESKVKRKGGQFAKQVGDTAIITPTEAGKGLANLRDPSGKERARKTLAKRAEQKEYRNSDDFRRAKDKEDRSKAISKQATKMLSLNKTERGKIANTGKAILSSLFQNAGDSLSKSASSELDIKVKKSENLKKAEKSTTKFLGKVRSQLAKELGIDEKSRNADFKRWDKERDQKAKAEVKRESKISKPARDEQQLVEDQRWFVREKKARIEQQKVWDEERKRARAAHTKTMADLKREGDYIGRGKKFISSLFDSKVTTKVTVTRTVTRTRTPTSKARRQIKSMP